MEMTEITKPNDSELKRSISVLEKERMMLSELIIRMRSGINKLHQVVDSKQDVRTSDKPSANDFLSTLNNNIYGLAALNSELEQLVVHLEKTI